MDSFRVYVTIHIWISLAHKLSGVYAMLFAAVPETIFSLVLPLIGFLGPGLGGWERKFAIYTCLVFLCLFFGTFNMILFWFNMCLNLHLTYVVTSSTPTSPDGDETKPTAIVDQNQTLVTEGNTEPNSTENKVESTSAKDETEMTGTEVKPEPMSPESREESTAMEDRAQIKPTVKEAQLKTIFSMATKKLPFWSMFVYCKGFVTSFHANLVSSIFLDRAFVAGFAAKWICYHCNISSFLLIIVLFGTLRQVCQAASAWAHGEHHKVNQTYRFERGDANTQLEFVKHKWRVFMLMFVSAAFCSMGQIHTASPSTTVPESISYIFCKMDRDTQLECVVNTTYFNPSASEAQKCFCDSTSSEWAFCGEFITYFTQRVSKRISHVKPERCQLRP